MCQSTNSTSFEIPSRIAIASTIDLETFKENFQKEYKTRERLMSCVQSRDSFALVNLGFAYLHGLHGFPKDRVKASKCLNDFVDPLLFLSRKEDTTFPPFLVFLELLTEVAGRELSGFQAPLYEACRFASERGLPEAQYNLGQMYQWGIPGVLRQDREEAFKWFKIAAGVLEIDIMDINPIFRGRAVMQQVRFGANAGQRHALRALYCYYSTGECPEQKPQHTKALHCLNKAVEKKDSLATRELGKLYMTGGNKAVNINPDRAIRWLQKAIEYGDEEAKELLKSCEEKRSVVKSTAYQYDDVPHLVDLDFPQQFEDMMKEKIQKESNTLPLFKNHYFITASKEVFESHSDSPTAKRYLKAYLLVEKGLSILKQSNFSDPSGVTFLAQAVILESTILKYFKLEIDCLERIGSFSKNVMKENSKFYEGLIIAFLLSSNILYRIKPSENPGLTPQMVLISNLIYFIEETHDSNTTLQSSPYDITNDYRTWLHHLYYWLASFWFVANVPGHFDEAFEAAKASLDLRPDFYEAKLILGVSLFSQHFKNQSRKANKQTCTSKDEALERAKTLILEFLAEAPVCDKKYPDGHYYMTDIYLQEENMKKVMEHYEKAQNAEEKRLSFLEPIDIPQKTLVGQLYSTFCFRTCQYPRCGKTKKLKENTVPLRRCPCGEVYYCNRECQKADWKNHKKHCAARKKKNPVVKATTGDE